MLDQDKDIKVNAVFNRIVYDDRLMVLRVKEIQHPEIEVFGKKPHITVGKDRQNGQDFFKRAFDDDKLEDSPTLKVIDLDEEVKVTGTLKGVIRDKS